MNITSYIHQNLVYIADSPQAIKTVLKSITWCFDYFEKKELANLTKSYDKGLGLLKIIKVMDEWKKFTYSLSKLAFQMLKTIDCIGILIDFADRYKLIDLGDCKMKINTILLPCNIIGKIKNVYDSTFKILHFTKDKIRIRQDLNNKIIALSIKISTPKRIKKILSLDERKKKWDKFQLYQRCSMLALHLSLLAIDLLEVGPFKNLVSGYKTALSASACLAGLGSLGFEIAQNPSHS